MAPRRIAISGEAMNRVHIEHAGDEDGIPIKHNAE
jgi:hypothetical protein